MKNIPLAGTFRQAGFTALIVALAAIARTGELRAQSSQPQSPLGAAVFGVLGGGVGVIGGAIVGLAVHCGYGCDGDFDGYGAAVAGALAGEALLLPLGVHLGNRASGNLVLDVGVSLGVGLGTVLLGVATESGAVVVIGGLTQLGLTLWTERSTGARAGRDAAFHATVLPDGRAGLGLRIQL